MTNTNATNFRKNLFEYLNLAIDFNDIINVNTKKVMLLLSVRMNITVSLKRSI